MSKTPFLHLPSGAYDLPTIMRRAWARARNSLARRTSLKIATTLRECFAETLRETWSEAKSARDYAKWAAAEDARLAAAKLLDARTREIMALETAKARAIGIDNTRAYLAELSAIDARLQEMRAAA